MQCRPSPPFATLARLAALLGGCATAYDLPPESGDDTDAGDGGAEAAGALDAASPGTSDAGPAQAANPQIGEIPAGGCTPGLCLTCDADGRVSLPEDDEHCPPLQCSTLDTYTLRTEGEVMICDLGVHVGAAKRCAAPGQCRAQVEEAACQPPRPLERARTAGPCQVIEGCQGATEPTVGPAPSGHPCGAGGLCRPDGTCDESVSERCAVFAATQVCDEGVHVDGNPYCDVANPPGANCIATCVASGGLCLAAFEANADAPCAEGAAVGCAEVRPQLRCRCRNPN